MPAKFPQTLPANTVVGRLGTGTGPAEAIPTSRLAASTLFSQYVVPVSSFGVVPDGTDQSTALNDAIVSYSATGGAMFQFGKGVYIFNSPIVLYPNIILSGLDMALTILKVGVDNISLIAPWGSAGQDTGIAGIEYLTVWGYADRNGFTQNTNALIGMGPFEYFWVRHVKAIYATEFSISGSGQAGIVDTCIVTKGLRDGINLTGTVNTIISNNHIVEVGDDAIAVHIPQTSITPSDYTTRILSNHIEKSYGIKCLGAQDCVIENNVMRFYYGYAINIGLDAVFAQGITRHNVSITGNTMEDGLNANEIGGGNINYAIFLHGGEDLGSAPNAITQYVGQYNASLQKIQTPDVFINKAGLTQPLGPTGAITIVGNTIRQTIANITNFSDAGFGSLWNSSGPINPAISTLIGGMNGIGIHDDCENLVISANAMHGILNGVHITGFLTNTKIDANTFFRVVGNGMNFNANTFVVTVNGSIDVTGNLFDIDPYLESPQRTSPIDGSWTVTDGSGRMGILFQNYNGVRITGNRFRNCIRAIKYVSGNYILEKNILEFDWSSGTRGIATLSGVDPSVDIVWFVNSDPTSVDFGKFDADFILSNATQPTAGYYYKGTFVRNNNPVIDVSNMIIWGWIRLTSGNAHVAGTDWAIARVSHVSPAT